MNIVVVGHVDHGKSTVIGRLMADTGSLPQGKLEAVKAHCAKNARPFEYAFLLDALKDEQAQGITIDTTRCFFKTEKRDYIIIDAPGHVEFLRNMVTGASRAEAALLVIDAHEGIKENSRRHGYLLSMLGVGKVVVLVNKMDLITYSMERFTQIRKEYEQFLSLIDIKPLGFIPVAARLGENIVQRAGWYSGKTVLETIESFAKEEPQDRKPFRFPVQDIYKFTENNDDRRIFAGTIESGAVRVDDPVVFLPSGKRSRIATLEGFNTSARREASAGSAVGFTLADELYVKRGEVMYREGEPEPRAGTRFKARLFWLGAFPMVKNRKYKIKLATARSAVYLAQVSLVIDAVSLSAHHGKAQIEKNDVAECALETSKPIAFDLATENSALSRFVIVDNYEISGGGTIISMESEETSLLRERIQNRENQWERSAITDIERKARHGHQAKFIVITGDSVEFISSVARALERGLFDAGNMAYYLGDSNLNLGLDTDLTDPSELREEHVRRLGELARIMTDSGQIFIVTLTECDAYDREILARLNAPYEIAFIAIQRDSLEPNSKAVLAISPDVSVAEAVESIGRYLQRESIIADYTI